MRFSEYFGLAGNQAEFDFVDIPLDTDIRLFLDPYALATTDTPWCQAAHSLACGFFQQVLNELRAKNDAAANELLSHLGEDNRTRTGYSKNRPQGTGLGSDKAAQFLEAVRSSHAFRTGQIQDIEDAALFVDRVGFDIVSDMMVNVLREMLAQYTVEQCALHNVPLSASDTFVAWRDGAGWTSITADLPSQGKRSILLIPRSILRGDLSLDADRYLSHFIDEYDKGNAEATLALAKMLQEIPTKTSGTAARGKLREKLIARGSIKEALSLLTDACPDALERYKKFARKERRVLTSSELEQVHPQPKDVDSLAIIAEMHDAAKNTPTDVEFGATIARAMIAALHPYVQNPQRRDDLATGFAGIIMANAGNRGMLWDARGRADREDHKNIVLLATVANIDVQTFGRIDSKRIMREADAGLIFLVGAAMDATLRKRRSKIIKSGVMPITTAELGTIIRDSEGPKKALKAIELLSCTS